LVPIDVTKNKQRQLEQEKALISTASSFVVNWFLGSGRWEKSTFDTLEAARAERDRRGADEYGRRGGVYCVAANGQSIFVE